MRKNEAQKLSKIYEMKQNTFSELICVKINLIKSAIICRNEERWKETKFSKYLKIKIRE